MSGGARESLLDFIEEKKQTFRDIPYDLWVGEGQTVCS